MGKVLKAKYVEYTENFKAAIEVTKDGQSVGGTSMMGRLMLAAGCGSTIEVTARGARAYPLVTGDWNRLKGIV